MLLSPRVLIGLGLGVLAVSWAAIFVRLADAAPLAVAAWRLTIASVPLLAVNALRRAPPVPRADLPTLALAGVALALHFGTWISSLALTTVASSVAIVTTQPVWVALLSALWLKERPRPLTLVGMGVALAGSVAIAGTDFGTSPRALWGDALALAGAVFAAVYLVIGRRVRERVELTRYIGVVYPVAAVGLLATAALAGVPLHGYPAKTWLFLAALALVPQLVGHSLLNWALKHTSAGLVSIAILGEPVFSTLLAVPLLGETPGPARVAGGVVVLVGVALAVRGESKPLPAQRGEVGRQAG